MNRQALGSCVLAASALALAGCASTGFTSTWRNPAAAPLDAARSPVAALVMSSQESLRRAAEDALAQEITAQGAKGVPVYTLTTATDEASVKAAVEKAGIPLVVVMRPVRSEQRLRVTHTMYAAPYYGGFWGGYYGYGWGSAWGPDVTADRIVTVETLVYSLRQNHLVWAGQSETANPPDVPAFVREVAAAAAKQLRTQGLIGPA